MQAYSERTKTTYDSWDDLVKAESNGWIVAIIVSDGKRTWPWIVGPYDTKKDAENSRVRQRNKWNKELKERRGYTASFFVRPTWKS